MYVSTVVCVCLLLLILASKIIFGIDVDVFFVVVLVEFVPFLVVVDDVILVVIVFADVGVDAFRHNDAFSARFFDHRKKISLVSFVIYLVVACVLVVDIVGIAVVAVVVVVVVAVAVVVVVLVVLVICSDCDDRCCCFSFYCCGSCC